MADSDVESTCSSCASSEESDSVDDEYYYQDFLNDMAQAEYDSDGVIKPYQFEPLATEEEAKQYEKEERIEEERRKRFEKRLSGEVSTDDWCKCGNCKTDKLTDAMECYCCQEVERIVESLSSDLVLEDTVTPPSCATLHPGFTPVCLSKWVLRLAGSYHKYICRKSYCKKGQEAKYFREIAYKEFRSLIEYKRESNGWILPIPACAYHAIRTKFHVDDKAPKISS